MQANFILTLIKKWETVVDDKLDHEDWKAIYKHCSKVIQDNEIIWNKISFVQD